MARDMPQVAAPASAPPVALPYWYKDAIVYQLHVKAFFDSDDDGSGDFSGLTEKLDYIRDLGVNTIWLLPFYPSPLRDDGYDVADYRNVNARYGTRADFQRFVREAHKRDLRVITELIINHTSDQHPWFQAARRAPPGTRKRNWYVWSDTPDRYAGTRIIFTDTEKSNWAWDDEAKAYYWHRFFSHQPDLNFDNPQVRKAIYRVMRLWLDMGVDGFRLDAIPYLCEREGTSNENLPETHAVLKELRALVDAHYPDVLLLAEANQWPEDVREYFGDGDECHMAYHFPLMPRMYMAIAQEDRHPITEIMAQTPDIPESCQWAIFLRNHDELTLEMVTSKERDYMYSMYAADKRARLNFGIRRRLAPLLENDLARIKLMNGLLLSMPGSPILYYGDEIGMGDNIYLGDRDGVRTPMQWRPERNAGFSRADPQRLYLPPIMDSIYGYEAVNVEAQSRAPSSLLNWTRQTLAVRKGFAAFGRGSLTFLRPANRKVLAYVREWGDETVLCVANLARFAQPVELDLAKYKGRVPIELRGLTPFSPVGDRPYALTLAGHDFLWFRLVAAEAVSEAPVVQESSLEELPFLVLFDGWASLFRDRVVPWRIALSDRLRSQLERELLPAFVAKRRWYAAKGEAVRQAEIADQVEWKPGDRSWLVAAVRVASADGDEQPYFLPLTIAFEDADERLLRSLSPVAISRVRQHSSVGILADAFSDEGFVRAVLQAVRDGITVKTARGTLRFNPTDAFTRLAGTDFANLPVSLAGAASSNTIIAVGDRLFVKGYRRLQAGTNPELEIGRYLTDVVHFEHSVPIAGSVDYLAEDGRTATLMLVQGYVTNQGDAWDYTLNYLGHYFEELARGAATATGVDVHNGYVTLMNTLGTRTAELHAAFARSTGDPMFDPVALTEADVASWVQSVRKEATVTIDLLAKQRDALAEPLRADADRLLAQRERLLARIGAHAKDRSTGAKTRLHGDYHLGQVLVTQNDFAIIDFEGEPSRKIAERAQKHSALKDVAGMLRSFDYALHAAASAFLAGRPDARDAVAQGGRQWRQLATAAFLDGYDGTAARSQGLASARAEERRLLELFMLEKGVYELRYELGNRPEWVAIPIAGLVEMLEQGN